MNKIHTLLNRWSMRKINKISHAGERVVHLYPNDCYFAHLSIYRFALDYCQNKRVLDAGCGAGYGAHYLSENGALSVLAVDSSLEAIRFCRKHFQKRNLEFRQMELSRIISLPERHYDVIFSSNTLEHVPGIGGFFHMANRLLKPDGLLILAIPPITNKETRDDNLSNIYHLHIWSPLQWEHFVNHYFSKIVVHRHICSRSDIKLDFSNGPDQCKITEKDFAFPPSTTEEIALKATISLILVAQYPKPLHEIPEKEGIIEFVDNSFSRPLPSSNVVSKAGYVTDSLKKQFSKVFSR